MLNTGQVRKSYDQVASKYAEARDLSSSAPYLEKLDSHLARGSRVLDLGCGAGLPVDRWLIDRGHSVFGLDISIEMLRLARQNVPEANYHLRDMATLKTGEFQADAVVCFFAMFHLDRCSHPQFLRLIRS